MRPDASTPAIHPSAGTMRAVVQDRYGTSDLLHVAQVAVPEPADHEVLIRVAAAGVDRGVWHLMTGLPYPVRLAGYGVRRPKERVRGRELAGRVVAVGSSVTAFDIGDDVYGIGEGTFAELATALEAKLARAPRRLTPVQAAVLPISGTTALQAVRDHGRVQPGQEVLVLGASGAVGSLAAQIARSYGARVTGVCSAGKADLVRSLGIEHVLDYERDVVPERRYDVIIDTGGNRTLRQLRKIATPDGTLVIVGAETGGRWLGGIQRNLRAALVNPFTAQTLTSFIASENATDLTVLADLVDDHGLRPIAGRIHSLEGARDAVEELASGRARGKPVVCP